MSTCHSVDRQRKGGIRFLPCEARPIPYVSLKQLHDAINPHSGDCRYERYHWGEILNVHQRRGYYEVVCEYGKVYTRYEHAWVAHKHGCGLPPLWVDNLNSAIHYAVDYPATGQEYHPDFFDENGNRVPTIAEWLEEWR